ncbi:MAG: nucleotide pyrophosphohydrolase [Patescibacteria group bacterium]
MIVAQKLVKKFVEARGWENQLPADVAKSISIEAAELLELFQWSSPRAADVKNDKQKFFDLKCELADVLIYCMHMATILGLDPEKIVRDKLVIAGKKYPVRLVRKYGENDTSATEKYLKIRNAYRKNRKK